MFSKAFEKTNCMSSIKFANYLRIKHPSTMTQPQGVTNPATRILAASLIGTTIEFFDFYIYKKARKIYIYVGACVYPIHKFS